MSPDIISYNSATWHALYGTFAHLDRLVYVGDVGSPCVISSRKSLLHPLNSDAGMNNIKYRHVYVYIYIYLSRLNYRGETS